MLCMDGLRANGCIRAQLQTMPVRNLVFHERLPCSYSFHCMWWPALCLVMPGAMVNRVQVPNRTVCWRDHFPAVFGNLWSQEAVYFQLWVLQHILSDCGPRAFNFWGDCWTSGLGVPVRDPDGYSRRQHRRHVQFQGPRVDDLPLGSSGQHGNDLGADYECVYHDASGVVRSTLSPVNNLMRMLTDKAIGVLFRCDRDGCGHYPYDRHSRVTAVIASSARGSQSAQRNGHRASESPEP